MRFILEACFHRATKTPTLVHLKNVFWLDNIPSCLNVKNTQQTSASVKGHDLTPTFTSAQTQFLPENESRKVKKCSHSQALSLMTVPRLSFYFQEQETGKHDSMISQNWVQKIRTSKEGFIVCVFDTMAHSDIFHLTQRHFQKIDIVCKRKIDIRKKLQGCQREPGKLHLRACSSSYLHQVDRNMPKEITFFSL